jgi:hypothetical protein
MLTIAITGHRSLHQKDKVCEALRQILTYYQAQEAEIEVLSALAVGADTLFAQEARRLGLPLRVLLPFAQAEYEKDFIKSGNLTELHLLLNAATEVQTVSATPTNEAERDAAYLACGQRLVQEANVLVAVWDGLPARGVGGTGAVVAYAQEQGKEIQYIKALRDEQTPKEEAEVLLGELDGQAIQYKSAFEQIWIGGLVAGWLAVVFFALGIAFKDTLHEHHHLLYALAVLEVLGVLVSWILLEKFAKKRKERFFTHRRDAEFLRSLVEFQKAGVAIPALEKPQYKVSEMMRQQEAKVMANLPQKLNLAHAKRLVWSLAAGQIAYHQDTRIPRLHGYEHTVELLLKVIKWSFFGLVGVKFLLETAHHFHLHLPFEATQWMPCLNFFVIVLPPSYAALEGVKYFGAWKQDIRTSKEIVARLTAIQKQVLDCESEQLLQAHTATLREILDFENGAWALQYEEKETESKP